MVVNGSDTLRTVKALKMLPERERGVCCTVELEVPETKAAEQVAVLKALADPTRLQMVLALRNASEPACICDFTATFKLSQPTVSHHMAKLRASGLVEATRRGIWTYYRLKPHLPAAVARIVEALG
jgi:ArsR family transcriptional regulator